MRRLLTGAGLVAGVIGLGVADARRRVRVIERTPERFPPREVRADVVGTDRVVRRPDGTEVAVRVAGDGRDVVLLHGYASSSRAFNLVQSRLLDAGFGTTCIDWRGHGRTVTGEDGITPELVTADIAAVLEELDISDCILVGHSTGGYVALAMLLEHPAASARVAGLVLMASLAGDASAHSPQTAMQIPLIQSGAMERIAAHPTLGPLFGTTIWGPDPSSTPIEVFLETFLTTDHQELVPLLERLAHSGYYDRLGEITQPTVVICGDADKTTPTSHAEAMIEGIPGAHAVWVPDAGHALNWQAPDDVIDAVTDLHARLRAQG